MQMFRGTRLHASRCQARVISSSIWYRPHTPARQAQRLFTARSLLDSAVFTTHSVLDGIHATTGLPWVLSLPLSALIVRVVVAGPLVIYARRVTERQLALSPLLQAWAHQIQRQVGVEGRAAALMPLDFDRRIQKAVRRKQWELFQRWHCGRWRLMAPLGQFPVWLIVVETIRRMCGAGKGLLGWLMGKDTIAVDVDRGEVLADLSMDRGNIVGINESLSREGALWFQDLLAPDPLLFLPFILSGTLLTHTFIGKKTILKMQEQSTIQRRLSNSGKVLALVVGPVALQVPSAILVYWISSSFFAMCQTVLLDKIMPIQPLVPPVKKERS